MLLRYPIFLLFIRGCPDPHAPPRLDPRIETMNLSGTYMWTFLERHSISLLANGEICDKPLLSHYIITATSSSYVM